jgi:hypothetical protein
MSISYTYEHHSERPRPERGAGAKRRGAPPPSERERGCPPPLVAERLGHTTSYGEVSPERAYDTCAMAEGPATTNR